MPLQPVMSWCTETDNHIILKLKKHTMEELQIGTAEIIYGEDGKVLRAFFTPKMQVGNIASQLLQLEPGKPERIKENAEMVLAAWFSKMNEIELADREHYKIESEIL